MSLKSKVRIQSVDRILDILEEISEEQNGLTVSELADRLDLQISTTFNLLGTLKNREYVHQDKETKKYFLGLKLLNFKNIFVQNIDIKKIAHPHLLELHNKMPETIHLAIMQGDALVPLVRFNAKYSVVVDSAYPGYKGPLYCTATGRALLLQYSEEQLNQLLEEEDIVSYTDHTITNEEAIKDEMKKSKVRGYTQDLMEYQEDVYCLGAPIYNHENIIVASISMSVPSIRFSPMEKKNIIEGIVATAKKISESLGQQLK